MYFSGMHLAVEFKAQSIWKLNHEITLVAARHGETEELYMRLMTWTNHYHDRGPADYHHSISITARLVAQ